MGDIVTHLLSSGLQPSSIPTYRRAWHIYSRFCSSLFHQHYPSYPIPPATLALFIAYLYKFKYAASTVNTYVSALGYFHRFAGHEDPTKIGYIIGMLKGYNKIGSRMDVRLPISLPILTQIVATSSRILVPTYISVMFNAMCALAFYAFLRIGEIVLTKSSNNIVQLNQVERTTDRFGNISAFKITFTSFKHHYNQSPVSLIISRQQSVCPVELLACFTADISRATFPTPGRKPS